MENYMEILGRRAKSASREGAKLGTAAKNRGLITVAEELIRQKVYLLEENAKDIKDFLMDILLHIDHYED